MQNQVTRQIELGRPAERFAQNCCLDLQLMCITGVLVVAATAPLKIRASWLPTIRRWLQNSFQTRAREARFLLGEGSFDLLTFEDERYEDGFSRATIIRWQAG